MSAPDRRWPPAWAAGLAGPDVDEAALYLALEAGSWPGELPVRERRAFALLVLASCDARQEGATRLSLRDSELEARLAALGAPGEDRAAVTALVATLPAHAALAPLVGRPGDLRPFIADGPFLYQERDLRLEERLADALATRLAAPPFAVADLEGARAAAAMKGRRWTAAQTAAIEAALARRLTAVSGGPGSGKTALIGGIVRAWRATGMAVGAIAIAAPTGKAANRIAEGLAPLAGAGLEAPIPGTLHRLLGFSGRASLRGGSFRHHENNRLPHAGVIVDEASMVDLELLEQLARALRPDARLVLIGDADQLPAIQAGSVFRDLGAIALRLPESHRMSPDDPSGAEILAAARQIAAGATPAARQSATGLDTLELSGFELVEPAETDVSGRRLLSAFLERWTALHLRPTGPVDRPRAFRADRGALAADGAAFTAAWLDRHRRARLLTVTRVGFTGADRLNALLARRARDELGAGAVELVPGTPVMLVENDYDRGLMNGDQGIVLWIESDAPGRPPATFVAFPRDGGLALYPFATLRGALSVSYATTVHKAQGSELDQAALILPEIDLPLLSRELVYTAITRARRSIVVVGRRALLQRAVERPLGRASGLAERLARRGAFAAG